MQGLPSKKDNLESDHELDHGLCEKKIKKKNDWEEDVCCRTYMGVWMEKFITVNFFAKDRFFPRSV